MTIPVNLIGDTLPVLVSDMTAQLGGSFYYEPLRPYSPLPMKWAWEQLIRYPKAVLIDVGAHTGCYTLLAKHHPDLTVYAFEPVERTELVLLENVHLNELENKVYVQLAGVSNYTGQGIVHSVRSMGGSGVSIVNGKPAWHKDCEDSPIEIITLDDFYETHPDMVPTLLKIDVEGAEKFVLEGAQKLIEQYHPFILTEYSPENIDQFGYAPSDIVKLLEGWDYVWTNPEGTDLWAVWKEWDKSNGKSE